ncbi:MAG: hypothetical protein ACREUQ_15805 [Burkholderiales bacterium]
MNKRLISLRAALVGAVAVVLFGGSVSSFGNESSRVFGFKGMPGNFTIEQAAKHPETKLQCEQDQDVPTLTSCVQLAATYVDKPAVLKLEFIDRTLSKLTVLVPEGHFDGVRSGVVGQFGQPARSQMTVDDAPPYMHLEWPLADGELILDERVVRFNPALGRHAWVSELVFYPAAMEKPRAEVFNSQLRAIKSRSNVRM